MIILFAKETNGASVKVGTARKQSIIQPPRSIIPDDDNNGFTVDYGNQLRGDGHYSLIGNIIKLNTVDSTNLGGEAICDKLRDEVFPKAGGPAITTLDQLADTASRVAVSPVQKSNIDTNTSKVKLPINSLAATEGDSLMAYAVVPGSNPTWGNNGMLFWAMMYAGFPLYFPPNGFKAVSGSRSSDVVIRLGALVALKPKVVFLNSGINDVTANIDAATIINNKTIEYGACLASGAKVVAFTIFPCFGASALTGPQETVRQAVNTFTRSLAGSDFVVVDGDVIGNDSTLYIDGKHPATAGAKVLGALTAPIILSILRSPSPLKMSDYLFGDASTFGTSYNANPLFAGTTGTFAGGASGSLATGWTLTAALAGGATVAASKASVNGLTPQDITLSGNYTGSSQQRIEAQYNYTTLVPSLGDIMEGYIDFEVLSIDANITAVTIECLVMNSSFAFLGFGGGYYPQEVNIQMPLIAGDRKMIRSIPFVVGAIASGIPAYVVTKVVIRLKDQTVSTPVSASFRFHKASIGKVTNADGQSLSGNLKLSGKVLLDSTITAAGSTGNKTINKASGTVNIAAAGTSVVVTNSLVNANSLIDLSLRTNDSTAWIKNYVASSGSFTINLGAAATAEVSIGFKVWN